MRRCPSYLRQYAKAWRESAAEALRQADHRCRTDANETAAFVRELEQVDTNVQNKKYPEDRYPILTFFSSGLIDPSIAPWAKTVTWRVKDWVGQMAWLAQNANDIPVIGEELGLEKTTPIERFAGRVLWDVDDIRYAVAMAINLPSDKLASLKEAANEFLDKALALGNTKRGFFGLLNQSTVTVDGAGQLPNGGDFANGAVTGAEILVDLTYMMTIIPDVTLNIYRPNILMLPQNRERVLKTKRVTTGLDTTETVFQAFTRENPNVQVIFTWRLNSANAAGTGPRAVVLQKDQDVVRGIVPVAYETLPPQYINVSVTTIAKGRCGGVQLRGPGGIRYFDDI